MRFHEIKICDFGSIRDIAVSLEEFLFKEVRIRSSMIGQVMIWKMVGSRGVKTRFDEKA
jgi:hypothetical protein